MALTISYDGRNIYSCAWVVSEWSKIDYKRTKNRGHVSTRTSEWALRFNKSVQFLRRKRKTRFRICQRNAKKYGRKNWRYRPIKATGKDKGNWTVVKTASSFPYQINTAKQGAVTSTDRHLRMLLTMLSASFYSNLFACIYLGHLYKVLALTLFLLNRCNQMPFKVKGVFQGRTIFYFHCPHSITCHS